MGPPPGSGSLAIPTSPASALCLTCSTANAGAPPSSRRRGLASGLASLAATWGLRAGPWESLCRSPHGRTPAPACAKRKPRRPGTSAGASGRAKAPHLCPPPPDRHTRRPTSAPRHLCAHLSPANSPTPQPGPAKAAAGWALDRSAPHSCSRAIAPTLPPCPRALGSAPHSGTPPANSCSGPPAPP
jgi:hypothetical protein